MTRLVKWTLRTMPIVLCCIAGWVILTSALPLWLKGLYLIPCVFFILVALEFYLPNFFILTPKFPCRLRDKQSVLLTFDDGPHPEITPKVLDILQQMDVKACFFCIQSHAQKHPDIIKRIIQDGHMLGSHSTHHESLPLKSNQAVTLELLEEIQYYKDHFNYQIEYFRYPRGRKSFWTQKAVEKIGLKTLGFSYAMYDVENPPPQQLINRAHNKINGGDIVLFHDGYEQGLANTDRSSLLEALPKIIQTVKEKSLTFVSLTEHTN